MKHDYKMPRNKSGWTPLMTTKELAEEFGITWQQLSAFILNYHGPKSICQARGKKYFRPSEMRSWWNEISQKHKKAND